MALIHWEPFREIDSLQREMNRMFDSLATRTPSREEREIAFIPAAEMYETPEAVHLRLEIPGMEAKDIDVQVTTEAVAISGERNAETQADENGMTRTEFRYGKFRRVIPLPSPVQNSKVQGVYKNGILSLLLPKLEAERNKVVKVNIS